MAVENFLQILNFSFSGWKIPFPLEVERLEAGHGSQRRRKASLMVVAAVALCKCSNGKVEKVLAALGIGKGEIFT